MRISFKVKKKKWKKKSGAAAVSTPCLFAERLDPIHSVISGIWDVYSVTLIKSQVAANVCLGDWALMESREEECVYWTHLPINSYSKVSVGVLQCNTVPRKGFSAVQPHCKLLTISRYLLNVAWVNEPNSSPFPLICNKVCTLAWGAVCPLKLLDEGWPSWLWPRAIVQVTWPTRRFRLSTLTMIKCERTCKNNSDLASWQRFFRSPVFCCFCSPLPLSAAK